MEPPKKRLLLMLVLTTALIGVALRLALSTSHGPLFVSPRECVDAYRDACHDGDAKRYLACLAEPLRAAERERYPDDQQLAERLRAESSGINSWAMEPSVEQGDQATVRAEKVGVTSRREVQFKLEHSRGSWRITSIEEGKEIPLPVPNGTGLGSEGP